MPPSRANANIMRELDVIEKVLPIKLSVCGTRNFFLVFYPQKYIAPITITMRTIAPRSPTVSRKIWATGCPVVEETVVFKSWIENKSPRMRNHPRRADTPIANTMPIDPAIAALWVSSVIYTIQFSRSSFQTLWAVSHMSTGIETFTSSSMTRILDASGIELTGQCVLCHENADDTNICMACPATPSLTASSTCIVNESAEHELSGLVRRSTSQYSYDQGRCSYGVPIDGNIVEVL
jgi:hypothetical protein